jgi:hypothetical protein
MATEALLGIQKDAAAAAAAVVQLEQQLAAVAADSAALEAYCAGVRGYTLQLAAFESEAQASLPTMQRLLADLDALVLPGGEGQGQEGSSALQRATEAAADAACGAALSPQSCITHMLMRGSISLVQYLRCVRALARRKFHAKYVGGGGQLPQ